MIRPPRARSTITAQGPGQAQPTTVAMSNGSQESTTITLPSTPGTYTYQAIYQDQNGTTAASDPVAVTITQ